jgi:hypothetical protein
MYTKGTNLTASQYEQVTAAYREARLHGDAWISSHAFPFTGGDKLRTSRGVALIPIQWRPIPVCPYCESGTHERRHG